MLRLVNDSIPGPRAQTAKPGGAGKEVFAWK